MVVMSTRTSDDAHVIGRIAVRDAVDARAPVSDASAVAWGAIFAGAAAAAALSLVLLILGTGLGLSSVSPWSSAGVTAATFGVSAILWITFTQVAASGMGGYLAGRLRTRWTEVHADEVYFRDTAHGLLTWAVASLFTVALLSSAIAAIVTQGVQTGTRTATGVADEGAAGAIAAARGDAGAANAESARLPTVLAPLGYYVDLLFRTGATSSLTAAQLSVGSSGAASRAAQRQEVAEILGRDLSSVRLPDEDARYLAVRVAQHTGLPIPLAQQRVLDTYARLQTTLRSAALETRRAADEARKTSAYVALWLFVALLGGAFVASLAATIGGRQRDL